MVTSLPLSTYLLALFELAVVFAVARIPVRPEWADRFVTAAVASIAVWAYLGVVLWFLIAVLVAATADQVSASMDFLKRLEFIVLCHPIFALAVGPVISLYLEISLRLDPEFADLREEAAKRERDVASAATPNKSFERTRER